MDKNIQHYKTIFKYGHTIEGPYEYEYESYELSLFNDSYLQQIWLKLLVEYKEEFKIIIWQRNSPIYIPIYNAHQLPLSEQVELFKLIKEFEDDDIFFNFFDNDFEDFEFKEPNLNDILQNAIYMTKITEDNKNQRNRIALHNLTETIRKVEYFTQHDEKPFEAPLKLKQKIELLRKLYNANNKNMTTRTPITQTAYHIFCNIFFSEDFELFHDLVIPHNANYNRFSYSERPPYHELCQKYGKTQIDYVIHQYLP